MFSKRELYPKKDIFVEVAIRTAGDDRASMITEVLQGHGFRRIRRRGDNVTAWRGGRSPGKLLSGDPRLIVHRVEISPGGIRYRLHNKWFRIITPTMEEVYRTEAADLANRFLGQTVNESLLANALSSAKDEFQRKIHSSAREFLLLFFFLELLPYLVAALVGGLAYLIFRMVT